MSLITLSELMSTIIQCVRPGEMILYHPAYLLSLYIQAVERQQRKDSDREYSYDLENYIRTEMVYREQQDMAVLPLQLIVLRLCEKLAKISQSQYSADLPAYSQGYDSLANIVRMIRNFEKSTAVCNLFYRKGTSNGD
jgi:hypothetical protein